MSLIQMLLFDLAQIICGTMLAQIIIMNGWPNMKNFLDVRIVRGFDEQYFKHAPYHILGITILE